MTINHSKTKVLNINVTTSPLPDVPLLNNVVTLKILGLIFCNSLSWSPHFDFVISKLSRHLYVLRVLRDLLSHDQLVSVFNAIIRSVMDYASPVFLNPGKCSDQRLLRICKRAFYIIHGRKSKYCKDCNMFNVTERRQLLSVRLFDVIKNDKLHILHDLVPKASVRSQRLILPHVQHSRRINDFFFFCALLQC